MQRLGVMLKTFWVINLPFIEKKKRFGCAYLLSVHQAFGPNNIFFSTPKETSSDSINLLDHPLRRIKNSKKIRHGGCEDRIYKSKSSFPFQGFNLLAILSMYFWHSTFLGSLQLRVSPIYVQGRVPMVQPESWTHWAWSSSSQRMGKMVHLFRFMRSPEVCPKKNRILKTLATSSLIGFKNKAASSAL
jgi:hypothetical protein